MRDLRGPANDRLECILPEMVLVAREFPAEAFCPSAAGTALGGTESSKARGEWRQRGLGCVVFFPSGGSRGSLSVYLRNSPLRRSIIRFRRAS